ncbi:MAG: sulfite exporter TauE/SafE family protein [Alphaproteobacteria bacterium]|nr:sulfite exporter TauE/SafE family protein [Alphaproteobacteria bacterium]
MSLLLLALAVLGLFLLSILAGMLGTGVGIAAIPFLGLFLDDLVHEVQPLALTLNGVTAGFAALAFARAGLVHWGRALALAALLLATTPLGAWLARFAPAPLLWGLFVASVVFAVWRILMVPATAAGRGPADRFAVALAGAAPIGIVAGLLGVGAGFLLVPALVACRVPVKQAAALNAVAVTPSSFAALLPHLDAAIWDTTLDLPLLAAGAIGGVAGARLTTGVLSALTVRLAFATALVALTALKLLQLLLRG